MSATASGKFSLINFQSIMNLGKKQVFMFMAFFMSSSMLFMVCNISAFQKYISFSNVLGKEFAILSFQEQLSGKQPIKDGCVNLYGINIFFI